MPNLEAFHPILTPHWKLDWLTAPSLKEVHQLRSQLGIKESYEATSTFISNAMRDTMGKRALSWAVIDQQDQALIGWVTIMNSNRPELQFHLMNSGRSIRNEITKHLESVMKEL